MFKGMSWSPDGRHLAYVVGGHAWEVNRVWVLRLADGEAVPVTDGLWNDHSPTWSTDGRTLFFISNRGGSKDLWQQRLGDDARPEGEATVRDRGGGDQPCRDVNRWLAPGVRKGRSGR